MSAKTRRQRTWRIIYYIGNQVYDEDIYVYYRKPVQFAGYCQGLATRFEIEEIEEKIDREGKRD